MSSKSASKVSLEDEILKKVKWRRVGVWFWSAIFVLALVVLVQVPLLLAVFVLLPLVLLRVHLISSSLLSTLGIRYNTKISLFFIDLAAFMVVYISYEWSLPTQNERNFRYYDPTKVVNWSRVLIGRFGWALLASFIFHRYIRSFYDLITGSVTQRRMFRMRLAMMDAMKVSLKLIGHLLVYLVALWLILQLFMNPLAYIFIGSSPSPTESSEEVDSGNSNFSSSEARSSASGTSPSSSTSSKSADAMRSRHKRVNADFILLTLFRLIIGGARDLLASMRIMTFSELFKRLFETLCLSFVLEMTWFISSIIFSERFSFLGFEDFASTLRKARGNKSSKFGGPQHRSLLKSKQAQPDQLLRNFQDSSSAASISGFDSPSEMLIKCLASPQPFVSLLALQDLHYISHHTPEMRSEIYKVTSSEIEARRLGIVDGKDNDSATSHWALLARFSVKTLDKTSEMLEKVVYTANGGDEKADKEKSKNKSGNSSRLLQLLQTLTKHRKAFDNKLRALFKWAKRDYVDVSLPTAISTFTTAPVLVQHQTNIITLLKSISKLISYSIKEDVNGTIASSQQTIPDLLNAMVRLYILLQEYSQQMGAAQSVKLAPAGSRGHSLQGHSIAFSFSHSLINALSESIYELTTTYYEYLVLYTFSEEHLEVLQRFMDFTA